MLVVAVDKWAREQHQTQRNSAIRNPQSKVKKSKDFLTILFGCVELSEEELLKALNFG